MDPATHYLEEARRQLRGHKRMAEGAIAQLKDEELFVALDPEANSVAVLVKHLAGNMRSRFTDFLTSDGDKPDRHRDQEFEMNSDTTRADVMHWWEEGWARVFSAIDALKPEDVMRTVTIRGEPHTVLQAINRQIAHYAQHIGQIVFLAKAFPLRRMEIAQHSARPVGRVQPADDGQADAVRAIRAHSDELMRTLGRMTMAVMRSRLLAVFVTVALVSTALAQQGSISADSDRSAEEEVKKLETEISDLVVRGQWDAYATHLAGDYCLGDIKPQTREEVLAELRSGQSKILNLFPEGLRVRVYGDTAVLTGHLTVLTRQAGKVITRYSQFTDVFLRRDGRWFLLSTQRTPVKE
jgi:hypothetical protein